MECKERLEWYLRENNVPFEEREHPITYTASEVAASEHVPGRMFAKAVMVVADGAMWMLVLPASERVRIDRVRDALHATGVRLASEGEFTPRFADCDAGAMPPFGHLYGVPMVVDASFSKTERIVFRAGTHTTTMSIAYQDYARLVRPRVAEIGSVPVDDSAREFAWSGKPPRGA